MASPDAKAAKMPDDTGNSNEEGTGTVERKPEHKDEENVTEKDTEAGDGSSGSNKTVLRKPGYAPIKSIFLVHDHKPTVNLEYVSSEIKEKLQSVDESDIQPGKHAASDEVLEGEPPQKMTKLKGRNNKRPRNVRIEEKDKICPAIKNNRECQYGDKCKFSHDKAEFLKQKPQDLEGKCPNFEKFGFCEYSIACRYASCHLTDTLDNVKNEELYESSKSSKATNILDHDLRHKLWKKKYDFQKSNKVVKEVEKNFRGWNTDKSKSNDSTVCPTTPIVQESPAPSLDSTSLSQSLPESSPKPPIPTPDITVHNNNVSRAASPKVETRTLGQITNEELFPMRPQEKVKIDFRDKLYLAPLTTVGNLPFRRVCKGYGADVTCGEMALASELLKGKLSEWSLIKRHPSENIFGAQICGCFPDLMTQCAQMMTESFDIDFIDINCGCPIELIYKRGSGSALMGKATKLEQICRSMMGVMGGTPLTVKLRTGVFDNKNVAHSLIPRLRNAGVSLVTVHGRSREQRYTKTANWDYISQCASLGDPMPVFGNGDILSYEDANLHMLQSGVSGVMIARGALIKPWIFTEIKEQRHWDISSGERLDMLRSFTNNGLEHWGSDSQGVENTRRFLLEWLSFLHRYIPVGVLEILPQKINERPPYYMGRNDLETLMSSTNCADWIKITEMLLGPVPDNFKFLPKHKANAYH